MTKKEIVTLVAQRTGVDTVETVATIEAFISVIKQGVKTGKTVTLRTFGTFEQVHRKEKKGRNITAGTQVTIPARNVVKFIPSKHFKVEQPSDHAH